MPKQRQSPETLIKTVVSISVKWLRDTQYGKNGKTTTFRKDNPYLRLFIGGNWFQIYDDERNQWLTFWEGFDYSERKIRYKADNL